MLGPGAQTEVACGNKSRYRGHFPQVRPIFFPQKKRDSDYRENQAGFFA